MKVDVNKYIQTIFTIGVIVSFIILLWGSVLLLLHPDTSRIHGPALDLQGVIALDAAATINLGLLVLIASPIIGVIAAGIAFGMDGEWKYVLIAAAVLVVLAAAMLFNLKA